MVIRRKKGRKLILGIHRGARRSSWEVFGGEIVEKDWCQKDNRISQGSEIVGGGKKREKA